MFGGVRGRELVTPSYSILYNFYDHFPFRHLIPYEKDCNRSYLTRFRHKRAKV